MAYDTTLAERIRESLKGADGVREKKMFGGLAFMLHGHMLVGIVDGTLMARIGPDGHAEALEAPHVREMDFTGRPMKGYVFVDPPGLERDDDLRKWLERCRAFVSHLPPKG